MSRSWSSMIVVAVALALPACRSGQGPGGGTPQAPAAPGAVEQLVGQTRVLRHRGDERKITLRRDDVARLSGDCDAVVDVTQAALQQGTLRLTLAHVGRPEIAGKRRAVRRRVCLPVPLTAVTVTKVTADTVAGALDALLPTIERYMETSGAAFNREPAEPEPPVADNTPGSTPEQRTAARQVTTWPVPLFMVDADVVRPKGLGVRENEADFTGVVGTDGRLHGPKVSTSLVEGHVKHLERVLGLWRYQPAKAGEREVPARVTGKAVLRLY